MNDADFAVFIMLAALIVLAGTYVGHRVGRDGGLRDGWDRCSAWRDQRNAMNKAARRDPATGRFRKVRI